ncbi:hypothetical protein [Mycolicibacterium vanbaalenii]|uniref:hypothetical protein n=1 Tax=Mycolicibacterium vanbaalenii TaxID=110539 RepID=UPI00190F3754|nr:hypothetical protein [Mycolicibacterium vanbaalenii]
MPVEPSAAGGTVLGTAEDGAGAGGTVVSVTMTVGVGLGAVGWLHAGTTMHMAAARTSAIRLLI